MRRPPAVIAAADGPTAIFVAMELGSRYLGAIIVAAYSYMALVPIIQPPVIKLLTTKKERRIRMPYKAQNVSKTTRILFPIFITLIAGLVAPKSASLVGFLMFGNLIRECGVLDSLSETAQKVLANLITIFLGITVAVQMTADDFLNWTTLAILALGLFGFIFDTFGGVMVAKFMNLFLKEKINPMIGASGISAFPMSARVVHKMGLAEDNQNFLLMHTIGVNVSGQVASVIAGGLILSFLADEREEIMESTSSVLESTLESTTNMPIGEVLEKAGLGLVSIFIVTGVIIFMIWLLNRLTSRKKKDDASPESK